MIEALFLIVLGAGLAFASVWVRRRMAGFYGQSPEDYEDGFPVFELHKHLNGDMICEGVIFRPFGRVTSSFTADFHIAWDGD